MKVAIKDYSQDPPKTLVEYELQEDIAVAIKGGDSAFAEDLEDDGVGFHTRSQEWAVMFPEDGEEFLEGLFWEFNFAQHCFVNAVATDAEGERIGGRFVRTAKACLKEARQARHETGS